MKKYLEYVDEESSGQEEADKNNDSYEDDNNGNNPNEDLFDEFYSSLIDESAARHPTLDNLITENNSTGQKKKEQNEYDFANSLLTIEYKPYNQYSMNFNYKNLCLSQNSLLTRVSLTSSSIGNYYKTMNRLKFQSNLTDKLVQINEFNFEETLKKLINTYTSIMPHLLYSLLKGKPVICVARSCSDLAYLESVVDCLSNFLPNSFYCLNSLTNKKSFNTSGDNTELADQNDAENHPKYTSSPCNNQYDSSGQQQHSRRSNDSVLVSQEHTSPNGHVLPQLRVICERKPIKLNDLKYCKLFGLCLMISKDGCCSNDCDQSAFYQNSSQANSSNANGGIKTTRLHNHKHYHMGKSFEIDSFFLKFIETTELTLI
jgi:hypothetical protein